MPLTADEDIAELLTNARTIAVVGASDRPDRASHGVMKALQDHGYRVIPVNPQITGEHVLGEFVWRELSQIGVPIDIVDIFRRPQAAGEEVDQAIAIGAKAVWLQLGIVHQRIHPPVAVPYRHMEKSRSGSTNPGTEWALRLAAAGRLRHNPARRLGPQT